MTQTIENIWTDGFLKEQGPLMPKINNFYDQKSIHIASRILRKFKRDVWMLIPISLVLFVFNLILDNDNSFFWGTISVLPCLALFYVGIKQFNSLRNINYGADCYDYLVSMRDKLNEITRYNKTLSTIMVSVYLFPMLLYTYYNNPDKTLGEIFGVPSLNWSNLTLFLLLPVIVFIAYFMIEMSFKQDKTRDKRIGSLIKEMEQLKE